MANVGIRALKQNASEVVARAANGEVVTVTDRGRPVARLVPLGSDAVSDLIASGRARPARRAVSELGPARAASSGSRHASPAAVLEAMRADERY